MRDIGVILYPEQEEFIALLSDAQRGQLLTALFSLAKGEEPVVNDKMVLMALTFFKQRHRHNAERYEEIRRVRSEAGKKGGAPKGNRNATKTHSEGEEKTSKNKQKQAKTSKTTFYNNNYIHTSDTNVSSCVNNAHTPTREEHARQLITDTAFIERTAMQMGTTGIQIQTLINQFNGEQDIKQSQHGDYNDYRRHAYDWIRIQIEKDRNTNRHGAEHIDNIRRAQEEQLARINAIAARDGGVYAEIPEPF